MVSATPSSRISARAEGTEQPRDVAETGLSESFIESLLIKTVFVAGTLSGDTLPQVGETVQLLTFWFTREPTFPTDSVRWAK